MPSIALSKGVGGNDAGLSARIQERDSTQDAIRNQVGAASDSAAQPAHQILPVWDTERACEFLPTKIRLVTDDCVEAACLGRKHCRLRRRVDQDRYGDG